VTKRHIRRTDLPWRPAAHTACGHPVSGKAGRGLLTVAEARAIPRPPYGQRYTDEVCQVCRDVTPFWPEWDADPVGRMWREVETLNKKRRAAVAGELRAIARLIELHRAEFQDLADAEAVFDALGRM
jgi:hypothetical protein